MKGLWSMENCLMGKEMFKVGKEMASTGEAQTFP